MQHLYWYALGFWSWIRLALELSFLIVNAGMFFPPIALSLKESQVYLRRNSAGEIDPEGKIWAAPYRWGCMVIAYKKSKFQKHKLAPIEVSFQVVSLYSHLYR